MMYMFLPYSSEKEKSKEEINITLHVTTESAVLKDSRKKLENIFIHKDTIIVVGVGIHGHPPSTTTISCHEPAMMDHQSEPAMGDPQSYKSMHYFFKSVHIK